MARTLSFFMFSVSQTKAAGGLLPSVFLPVLSASYTLSRMIMNYNKTNKCYKNTSTDISRYRSNPSSVFLQLVLFYKVLDQHCCKCLSGPYGEWWKQSSSRLLPTQYQLFVTDASYRFPADGFVWSSFSLSAELGHKDAQQVFWTWT